MQAKPEVLLKGGDETFYFPCPKDVPQSYAHRKQPSGFEPQLVEAAKMPTRAHPVPSGVTTHDRFGVALNGKLINAAETHYSMKHNNNRLHE
jgi:hypothetical protein